MTVKWSDRRTAFSRSLSCLHWVLKAAVSGKREVRHRGISSPRHKMRIVWSDLRGDLR